MFVSETQKSFYSPVELNTAHVAMKHVSRGSPTAHVAMKYVSRGSPTAHVAMKYVSRGLPTNLKDIL